MSLYIGALAFPAGPAQSQVRLGVIVGSLLSAAVGMILLSLAARRRLARGAATPDI